MKSKGVTTLNECFVMVVFTLWLNKVNVFANCVVPENIHDFLELALI